MTEIEKEIKARIRAKRRELGIRQKQMQFFMNMSAGAYSALEIGKRHINTNDIKKLCIILKLSPNNLLGWKKNNKKVTDEG